MVVVNVNKNNTYTVNDVYQWDTHRRLDIYGLKLTALPEIHFVNSKMSQAIVKQTSWNENGGIKVEIPNVVLETPLPITIYICGYEGEEFITMYSLTLKVKSRIKPADYIAEDDEKIYSYNALENLVNNTIVNLTKANEDLHAQITEENEALHTRIIEEVNTANNNTILEVNNLKTQTIEEFNNIKNQTIEEVGDNVTQAIKTVKGFKSHSTTFNTDGSITTSYEDGTSETTIFNEDGSITQRIVLENNQVLISNTVFNEDGSITTTVREESEA